MYLVKIQVVVVLKTGGIRRTYNKRRKKMPSAIKQTGWKKMGYKSMSDCMSYGKKKVGDLNKDGKMSSYESKGQLYRKQ